MHRPDECKRALCLLRGTAGGFFKTSHAVTSEARAEHLELFHRATTSETVRTILANVLGYIEALIVE